MKQTEILAPGPLLDSEGQLRRPGYSKTYVQTYDRKAIRVSPLRIKEWDYYLVSNGRFALALTVADNGYMGLDSVSLLALDEGWEIKSYYYSEDRVDIWNMDNMFCYVLVFDTKYDSNNRDSDSLRDLVVASVEYLGVNDSAVLSIPLD